MALIRPVVARGILRTMKMSTGSKMPLIAGHKLLYECNLRCKMCPFWRREDEKLLDIDEEVKMMESLKRAGVSFLGFEGGEPLLRNDIGEILHESFRRFHTSMVTNGWLLKQKIRSISDDLNYLFVLAGQEKYGVFSHVNSVLNFGCYARVVQVEYQVIIVFHIFPDPYSRFDDKTNIWRVG